MTPGVLVGEDGGMEPSGHPRGPSAPHGRSAPRGHRGPRVAPVARPYGPTAVLVEVADHREARALAEWLHGQGLDAREVVPAACTVLLDGVAGRSSDGLDALARVRDALARWDGALVPARDRAPVEVPVVYDGPDLSAVAALWDVDEAEVVRRHTGTTFVSAFCGFAPGFSYLAGLPAQWRVPRLSSPRSRVPAGSVALADQWCGIYPSASPGGWRVLGRTDLAVWDLRRPEPSLLPPGALVRFVVA